MQKSRRVLSALLAAVAASVPATLFAEQSANSSSTPVQQGQTNGVNNPAETITFEGQGSLNKIIGSAAFGYLNLSGTYGTPTITLNNGPGGTAVTYSDTSTSTSAYLNLASQNFTAADVGVNSPGTAQQTASALRLEWHWNGTVDGSNDLINDQVGYDQATGPVSPSGGALRGPTTANPIYVNGTNHFDGTATGSGPNNMVTLNGLSLSNNTGVGTYNTYSATNYDQAGNNLLGGMNRVQFSFSDYKTIDYSAAGTASVFATPGTAGYGNGNPALAASSNLLGIGVVGAREAYQSGSIANMPTTNIDPGTVSIGNPGGTAYASGPWNTAGLGNISSTPVAANAVLMAADPGTGLSRLNDSDCQWIQTTGRLANGLQFNTVTRDADLGQRPAFATATGIDGTWAVGMNDGGNTTTSTNATLQHSIGTMKFSGKSSDTEVYNTIGNSRMGIGVLALTSTIAAGSQAPVRSLSIDFNAMTDPQLAGGGTDDSQFVAANLNTISTYQYKAVLLGYVTTIKAPNATALANYMAADPGLSAAQAWAQMGSFNPTNLSDPTTTGIKGDTTGDVAKFLANMLNSQASYQSLTTTNDPADAFLNNSYLLPNLLQNSLDPATGVISANPNYDAAGFAKATVIYGNKFNANYSGSYGKVTETTGVNSFYGGGYTSGTSPATFNGAIPITAYNADGTVAADGVLAPRGNWLFGNFNQNGVRDLSAVESGLSAAKALYNVEPAGTSAPNSAFSVTSGTANASNSTPVSYIDVNGNTWNMTKGDLIALGDFNSVGRFDGGSLYSLATGAAVSDSTGTGFTNGTLSGGMAGFADSLRSGQLRKNTALDYMQNNTADAAYSGATPTNASGFLRQSAAQWKLNEWQQYYPSATQQDPLGANAFNKFDVNGTGNLSVTSGTNAGEYLDAKIVQKFIGEDYTNLTQELSATIASNGTPIADSTQSYGSATAPRPFNLAMAKLTDGPTTITSSDFDMIATDILIKNTGNPNAALIPGDANLDGKVDLSDLTILASNWGKSNESWFDGNFDLSSGLGTVGLSDLTILASNWNPALNNNLSFTAAVDEFPVLAQAEDSLPEPSSLGVAAAVGAVVLMRRHRRAR